MHVVDIFSTLSIFVPAARPQHFFLQVFNMLQDVFPNYRNRHTHTVILWLQSVSQLRRVLQHCSDWIVVSNVQQSMQGKKKCKLSDTVAFW